MKVELSQTEHAAKRIEASKATVGNFITKGIDEYFNKDVINQIYSKIEPHPKLTEIDISGSIPALFPMFYQIMALFNSTAIPAEF